MADGGYRENWPVMAVGMLVAVGGVGLWYVEGVGLGWLSVCLGGAMVGFIADGDGFRQAGRAVLPLVGLAVVGVLADFVVDSPPSSAMDVTVALFGGMLLFQLLVLVVTPFVLADGVGGWFRKQVSGWLGG